MKRFIHRFGLLVFLQVFLAVTTDSDRNETKKSCVPAHPLPNIVNVCLPYKYFENGHCRNIIGNQTIYGSEWDQYRSEASYQQIFKGKKLIEKYNKIRIRESCFELWFDATCRYNFPKCDRTSSTPKRKSVCRETCENFIKFCDREAKILLEFNKNRGGGSGNEYPLYWSDVINCSNTDYRNGGDIPECYYRRQLNTETDKLKEKVCYYGNGLGYYGNVNVTRSGHVCQTWSSQCPHRHDHPLSEYPELVNASNWCRNPGGQGPKGPWCYTTNSSIRWEYCNVQKCPDPGPTEAPVVVKAYAKGPSRISVTWNPVPLPFMHGQPQGFRIKLSKLGRNLFVNTTRPNITAFEYKSLQALTNYSLSVLAFNDAGDGPWSRPVYVITMPRNYVNVRYTLHLLKGNIKDKRKVSSEIKKMILQLFENKEPSGYSIFQIKTDKFVKSRFQLDFVITAELKQRSSWSAVQDITGRILQGFKSNNKIAKDIELDSLVVQALPPPPASVRKRDVQKKSATVEWSAPLYHGPYRITNYSLLYKKANTEMPYYRAVTVKSNIKKITVKSLDSDTKYLMRVTSNNAYGSKSSEPVEVVTQKDVVNIESILSVVLPLIVLIVIGGVVFVKWWYKKRKENKELQNKLKKLLENPYDSPVDWFEVLKINITKQWWEIPRDDLLIDDELGSGAFGVVMKGYLRKREESDNGNCIICAVKMLKEHPSESEISNFCNEINIMSSVGDHPNHVSLIGACTINGPPWLVVKFAPNGCLLDYLKSNRLELEYQNTSDVITSQLEPKPLCERERVKFAYDIAQGMAYLERHRFIHRDLAARNILLGENMVAMVSDFGLTRDIYESGAYENTAGGNLPVRWMALESLQDYTYTSKSDVWSYGVVLWEIESGGLMPYAGITGHEVVEQLRKGYRLERSNNTSRDIYEIMWKCWNPDPNQRPTFADLVYKIGGLINLSQEFKESKAVFNDNKNHHGNHPRHVDSSACEMTSEPANMMEEIRNDESFTEFRDTKVNCQYRENIAMTQTFDI